MVWILVEKDVDSNSLVSGKRKSNSSVREGKALFCLFMLDVLCSFRKYDGFGIMDRCLKCKHYEEFLRIMDEEDQKVMDEIEEFRRHNPYG